MILRVAGGLVILLGLFWVSPFGAQADDSILPEIPLIELNSLIDPALDDLEDFAEDIAETFDPEEPDLSSASLDEEEDEEPPLIWDCEMQLDVDGNEVERCGLGYYRTLCMDEAGQDCVTFFQFYEEEVPEPDPLIEDIEDLAKREYLALSLTWNGSPLVEGEDAFPLETAGTLGWSYIADVPEDMDLPYTYTGTYEEMLAASTLTLQIYQGEIGSATLVYSEEIPPGTTSGTLPFTALEVDTYRVMLSSTFPLEHEVPGYVCSGELCPLFEPRIESLEWFMRNAAAYYDDVEDEVDETVHFEEYGEGRSRMSTYLPFSFGMVEVGTGEAPTGISNVLFLPGIKGSRLYRPTDSCDPDLALSCLGVKLWEPSGDVLLRDLFLSVSGQSGRDDIYTKENDIVSDVLGNNFYASFVNQMNALKADGTLTDWKPIAYDWRLSLDDIVNKGIERDGKIYYQRPTETPYIESTLRELAASSPTGKVSLIAHSNGGLVAKKLMQRLEASGDTDLVDTIIFVGVPQSGAPQAMAGLLYGYGEALPKDQCAEGAFTGWLCSLLGSRDIARALAEHSPMAYHLLPSQAYFDQISGIGHPLAKFSALTAYAEERNRYGVSVDSSGELYDFLAARDGGRTKPVPEDTASANVLGSYFLEYARSTHDNLDSWIPPAGVQVYQIAGWGMNTVSGVEFYEQRKLFGGYKEMYRPMFVEDGDGVVPVPSALLMSAGLENVENYWINLEQARTNLAKFDHGNLFEIPSVRVLLRDILLKVNSLPSLITQERPEALGEDSKKLIFFLHSPLTLELYDKNGNHLGEGEDGSFDEEIPDAEYGQFGDVKYIVAPAAEYDVVMNGKSSGTFSLDVQTLSGTEVTSSFTLADVPATEDTVATISVSSDLTQSSSLQVDENGDGTTDLELSPEIDVTTVFEPAAVAVEEDSETSTSRSTRVKEIGATNVPPLAVAQVVVQSLAPRSPTKPLVLATQNEGTNPVREVVSVEINSLEGVLPLTQTRTQTASAYDALGTEIMKWLGDVLYNFWENFKTIFANLLPKK
jgi:pimeloyl-ACP methyl ester carboxylesterase